MEGKTFRSHKTQLSKADKCFMLQVVKNAVVISCILVYHLWRRQRHV